MFLFDLDYNFFLLRLRFYLAQIARLLFVILLRLENEFCQRFENCQTDGVEQRQTQMTDEVDGAPELDGRVDPQKPEAHPEVRKPLKADEPPDPIVGLSHLVESVFDEFSPQDFVEQILDRQHEGAGAE